MVDSAVVRSCPICNGEAMAFDVVDFNKSCVEPTGTFLPLSGVPIYYFLCGRCNFCFAPEMHSWRPAEFAEKVYNGEYIKVDPDWIETRPRGNAGHLVQVFGATPPVRHLDYGGGLGLMSDLLQGEGWDSRSYDPFVDVDVRLDDLGKFDLITSFEVFEHVPDSTRLIADLASRLADDGIIYFSTLLNEGSVVRGQRLSWWYASPRNGHISLFSKDSLFRLGEREGLNFGSVTPNLHLFWRTVPPWARHLFGEGRVPVILTRVIKDIITQRRSGVAAAERIDLSAPSVLNVGGGSKAIPDSRALQGLSPCPARYRRARRSGSRRRRSQADRASRRAVRRGVLLAQPRALPQARGRQSSGGFLHVLKPDGFVEIRVPDLKSVMRRAVAEDMSLEDTLYESKLGPITVRDVIYGYGKEIEQLGADFYSHKTGYVAASLESLLNSTGFARVYVTERPDMYELHALAFKAEPTPQRRALLGL